MLKPRCEATAATIIGTADACGDGVYLYVIPNNSGSTYQWTVVNGDVIKQNNHQIWVKWWNNAVNGSITVQESQAAIGTLKDQ
jgi:hypothetical protein